MSRRRGKHLVFAGVVGLLALTSQVRLFGSWPAIAWITMMILSFVWLVVALSDLHHASHAGEPRGNVRD